MSKTAPLPSILPGALAGALVATLVLLLAPPGPRQATSDVPASGPAAEDPDSAAEMLALLREIRDELQARPPQAPPATGAARTSPASAPLDEPTVDRGGRMPVGDGFDADLVAAIDELNASLRRVPQLLPKSSLPPRGGVVPANRLALLGLEEYMQLIETTIDVDEDRVEVWEADFSEVHYGLTAEEVHARFGPPDEFYTSDESRSITWRYFHTIGENGYARVDFRLLDGVVTRSSPRYRRPE